MRVIKTISIPKDLADLMAELDRKAKVNWSHVAQEAFLSVIESRLSVITLRDRSGEVVARIPKKTGTTSHTGGNTL